MAEIVRREGNANIHPYKKAASETFAFNDVVTRNESGFLTKATSSTGRGKIVGLIQRDVLATDTDYADNSYVPVDVPKEEEEFEFPVESGSAVQAYVGKRFDLNSEDGIGVGATFQSKQVVEITRVLSTTLVRGKFLMEGQRGRLVNYSQTVTYNQFTDGGAAVGTLSLSVTIPVGAVFQYSLVNAITGFAGDTSAALEIGDGTDADRYQAASTINVFASADAASAGAPNGTLYHSTAKTPVLTITTNSDWGSVTAGQLTVTLFWFEAAN